MNKDQIAGTLKSAMGRAQRQAGKATGSNDQQAKGLIKQGQGKLQKAYGDLKAAFKSTRHS